MIYWIFKKAFATLCGLIGIFIFNSLNIGNITLGFNLINGALIGLFGIPGIFSVIGLNILL